MKLRNINVTVQCPECKNDIAIEGSNADIKYDILNDSCVCEACFKKLQEENTSLKEKVDEFERIVSELEEQKAELEQEKGLLKSEIEDLKGLF